jgi:hypothetical protein
MRFLPTPEPKKMKIIRVRIPEALERKYQSDAKAADMDIQALYRQALEFAASDEPAPTEQPVEGVSKRARKQAAV